MDIVLYCLAALVIIFLLVIIVRTLLFTPKNNIKADDNEVSFEKEKAVENLQKLVQFKTVSFDEKEKEDDKEFRALLDALPSLYKNVFKICDTLELADRGLLIHWKGKNSENPTVLMAHYDVVPVNEELWEKPAFEGIIEDGVLWGRGTLDTKVTLNAALFAADTLIEKGFIPKNDIYFAFSGGEEVNGMGAVNIVNFFKENNIKVNMVVDEGGAVVKDVFPGVKESCGLIGIAEKGMMNVSYNAKSMGGHASAPKPNTPLIRLSKAILKVEKNPFKMHITKPVAEMFDTLGRHSNFLYRMIFANLWLFAGVLDGIAKKGGGEMNALLRTTTAFTQSTGSAAPNVIPPSAAIVSNMRLNPEDTTDSALAYLKEVTKGENVEIEKIIGTNPSTISETGCEQWDRIAQAVASTWKGCIVSPYLMVQCSDSRHYNGFSNHVYRFSAMDLTSEERATIHGNNEKIRIETIHKAVEFYIRLINKC
ncbi:MAG: M20/M25/M40 family metallo-hydrolase [Ruminococcaceae bacterium]|nr:M20/M25/M40 family metallo-hydrolase [Oscillospiraceae bacterium]